jgi:hypothetical protein
MLNHSPNNLAPAMFRLSRAFQLRQQIPIRRPVRSQPRIQSRYNSNRTSNHAPQNVQAVRFRTPVFSLKRLISLGIYIAVPYGCWMYLTQSIEIQIEEVEGGSQHQHNEAQWEVQEAEGEEDIYADEDSTFIPMTWATKLPRTFYKGSDPEWQEFVKIAKDKPRHKKLQNELVALVLQAAKQHPRVAMSTGKDLKVGKYWLEITFPDAPPQEYERSGIEIGDDFIAWSPQKISAENYHRLTRALWPKATFDGAWQTAKIFGGINYRRLKQALGWEEVNPVSPEERFKVALEMLEKKKQNTGGRGGSPVGGEAQTSPDGSPGSLVSVSSAANEAQSSPKASEERSVMPWFNPPVPASTDLVNPTDIQIAKYVFFGALKKQWNPKKLEPPRGTFVVQGLVEIKGSKGRVMFDVQSCYDPKEAKYVVVNAGIRSIKPWNQKPKGGP